MNIQVLVKYEGNFFLSQAWFDNEVHIQNGWGQEQKIDKIERMWIVDDNGVQEITSDDLICALKPLCDKNGKTICCGQYVVRMRKSQPTIYKIISMKHNRVSLQGVYDPNYEVEDHIFNFTRSQIKKDWMVIQ